MRRVVGLLVCAGILVLLAWQAVDEVRMDLRHEVARATVDAVAAGKWVDSVDVTFTTSEGRTVRAQVDQVWLLTRPDLPRDVVVEYDPADPRRARIAGSHTFLATTVLLGGVCVLVLVSVAHDARRRTRRRRSDVAGPASSGPAA